MSSVFFDFDSVMKGFMLLDWYFNKGSSLYYAAHRFLSVLCFLTVFLIHL